MGIFPGGGKIIEQVVPIDNIDQLTCQDKFKGSIDEHGTCLIRVRVDPSNPDKVELLRLNYIHRGAKSDGRAFTPTP